MTTDQLLELEKDVLNDIVDGQLSRNTAKDLIRSFMVRYAEAVRDEDRKEISKNTKLKFGLRKFTAESVSVDKNSIINAPKIDLL